VSSPGKRPREATTPPKAKESKHLRYEDLVNRPDPNTEAHDIGKTGMEVDEDDQDEKQSVTQESDHHEQQDNEETHILIAKATRAELEWIAKIEKADNADAIHEIVTEMGVEDLTGNLVNYVIETASRDFKCSNCNSTPQGAKPWLYNHGTGTYCCPNEIVNHINGSTGLCMQESSPLSFWARLVGGEAPCQRTLKSTAMQAHFRRIFTNEIPTLDKLNAYRIKTTTKLANLNHTLLQISLARNIDGTSKLERQILKLTRDLY
jgi:hypothetical protein